MCVVSKFCTQQKQKGTKGKETRRERKRKGREGMRGKGEGEVKEIHKLMRIRLLLQLATFANQRKG